MENGLRLLHGADLDVTLFVVQSGGFENAPPDLVEEFDDDEDDEIFPTEESCERMLDDARKRCRALGVDATCKIASGRKVKAILQEAAHHDLIVMHELSRNELAEKLRMSATESIARKVGCSVLLVADQ